MSTQTVYPALLPLWRELQSFIDRAHSQNSNLAQPPRVCFVGRFKTGKSRLINALVGNDDLLPYNTDECTAQLVEIVWSGRDKASLLGSLDLDSAAEQPMTVEQFRKAVDLTAMADARERTTGATAYRRCLTSHLLLSARIVDTPGFDGPNSEARGRAEQIREQAIKQSNLCVLVLSAGLGEDDIRCARLIQSYGLEMVVVLNQSDKYDAGERQEIQEQILQDLSEKVGVNPLYYTCSALWQNGNEGDRKALQKQRQDFDEEKDAEWHQWDALIRYLSRGNNGSRQVALMATIHRTFEAAQQVHEAYDLTIQAEAVFLESLSRWRQMMSSLIGQAVLEMAVSAAKSGKPLPWKRLQNFGITPTVVAPEIILPLDELDKLVKVYVKTLTEIVRFAGEQHSAALYRFLLSDAALFAAWLEENTDVPAALSSAMKSSISDAAWYSQPLKTDFTYQTAFSALRERWNTRPAVMRADCTRIRQRLAASLA